MNIKEIARQVVESLPPDADFGDLEEFLWERHEVEQGRDDFLAGRRRSLDEVLPEATYVSPMSRRVEWSEHAAVALEEMAQAIAAAPLEAEPLKPAVIRALEQIIESPEVGLSIPEMGDSSIREVHFRLPRPICRIVYDVHAGVVRVLWFTDNRTCYRGGRWPPETVRQPRDSG